jgi:hypothetical protein
MKKNVLLCLAMFLAVGFVHAQETPPVEDVTGADELVEEKGVFQATWVHPDADITRYSKLYLWNAVFQFREGGASSAGTTITMSRGYDDAFAVREEDQQRFEQLVSDTVVKELERSKIFEVVDEVGPGTLILRGAVLDIVSFVPPNVNRSANVYLTAVGEATIVFELIDAETGVIQARVAERRRIQPPGRMYDVSKAPTNAATVWNDVERWAREEARTLRNALEKAKKKAEK